MGRTLKRVPLDFDWPKKEIWEGYINPHYKQCPDCENGYSIAGEWLGAFVRFLLLTGSDSVSPRRIHPWLRVPEMALRLEVSPELGSLVDGLTEGALLSKDRYDSSDVFMVMNKIIVVAGLDPETWGRLKDGEYTSAYAWLKYLVGILLFAGQIGGKHRTALTYIPTGGLPSQRPSPDMADLMAGLAGRPPDEVLGHDSLDSWHALKKIREAAGPNLDAWGICPTCEGNAVDPAEAEAYNAWEPEEPPTGEGYQMWETTTEGSPESPVFASLDELSAWCVENATTFADYTASAEEWKKMLMDGCVYHQMDNIILM